MALPKLKPPTDSPTSPFTWDAPPYSPQDSGSAQSPPSVWYSAQEMKMQAARPIYSHSDLGFVKCPYCDKSLLRTFFAEHSSTCAIIRAGAKKGIKKLDTDAKKRKGDPPTEESSKKKAKLNPPPKVTKGRLKGPIDYDRQCGVINDKGLPCSRSLTCKSHSMGAKRSVEGRSRKYDELLLDWQRANNPNFVEPVKKETKAEKKEKREREKLEKKRLATEAAAALAADPANPSMKKAAVSGNTKKVGKKAAAAAAAAVRLAEELVGDVSDDLDDLDSEAELDELVRAVRSAEDKGIIGVPLAVPCDASSWFVPRRERARCCRDLLLGALGSGGGTGAPGAIGALGMVNRSASLGHNVGMGGVRLA